MSHSPPIPPGNQSIYPIDEPRHVPPVVARPASSPAKVRDSGRLIGKLVAGGLGAGIAVGTVALIVSLRRKPDDQSRSTQRTAAGNPSTKRASAGAAKPKARVQRRKAPVRGNKPNAPTPRAARAARAAADDKSQHGPRDAARIAMSEDYEVRYWTKKFGVDRNELQRAVDTVGDGSAAVERELQRG